MLRKIYWLIIAMIFVASFFQLLGYSLIEAIILLILASLVLVEILRMEEFERISEVLENEISHKIDGIERVVNYIFKNVSSTVTMEHLETLERAFKKELERKNAEVTQKMREDMERLAGKIIEIENRLTEMKNHSDLVRKRVENIEDYLFEEEF